MSTPIRDLSMHSTIAFWVQAGLAIVALIATIFIGIRVIRNKIKHSN
jgi:hypothetical protein